MLNVDYLFLNIREKTVQANGQNNTWHKYQDVCERIKNMEKNDIMNRHAFATARPTVEYSLTVKKLEPIINELYKWGPEYVNS